MNTIISRRSTTFTYHKWEVINNQIHAVGPGIVINGGAGIVGGAELLSGRPLEKRNTLIPVGVMTFVDDDTLDVLMSIRKFRSDIEKGLIEVVKGHRISDQEKVDDIARKNMIPDENIPSRPISEDDIRNAGGKMNSDGSIDISKAEEDIDLIRRQNAGQPFYVKKRLKDERNERRVRKARNSK